MNEKVWSTPHWMESFVGVLLPPMNELERHMNAGEKVNVVTNAPFTLAVIDTKARVNILTRLYNNGLLKIPEQEMEDDHAGENTSLPISRNDRGEGS